MRRRRAVAGAVAAAVIFAAIGVVAIARRATISTAGDEVPTSRVQQGDLDLKVYATGELRANHSITLIAPAIGGGALQITQLAHTGIAVKKTDVVVEFDPSEQHYKLEQNRSELLQAEQEITKAKADAAVQAAQDKVALLKARFDVRRAELDVQKNELVSVIDGKKNQLALDQARRALEELEQDIKSHSVSGQAGVYLAQEKRNKARLAMDQAQENIGKMRVVSPMDGLIAIEKNREAAGMMIEGVSMPDYHVGDQVEPGSGIAQAIDPTEMEISSKINEQDRSNIKPGQAAEIEFDALPGQIFHGTVKTVGGISTRNFWDDDADNTGGKFDVSIQLPISDSRLRPGLSAQVVILGDKRKNVLTVPRQALFLKNGKRIVYLKNGNGFEEREVKIQCENESRSAVENLTLQSEVALIDPTAPRKSGSSGQNASAAGGTP